MPAGDVSGVLLIDKPEGPTSREVLDTLERSLQIRPLGHAGTLDPLASGLLVGLSGTARRLQDVFLAATKVYEATVRLGFESETLDREGPIRPSGRPVPILDLEAARVAVKPFIGEISQVPPAHAAVHVFGRRAHELARKGEAPVLTPRRVRIEAIEVLSCESEHLQLRIRCGPGTYIRSLARDLGEALGCGAYLHALRRTRTGHFMVDNACPPEALTPEHIHPLTEVLAPYPRVDVGERKAERLSHGAWVPGMIPPGEGPAFAWFDGEPLCRLVAVDATRFRSDLLLVPRRP